MRRRRVPNRSSHDLAVVQLEQSRIVLDEPDEIVDLKDELEEKSRREIDPLRFQLDFAHFRDESLQILLVEIGEVDLVVGATDDETVEPAEHIDEELRAVEYFQGAARAFVDGQFDFDLGLARALLVDRVDVEMELVEVVLDGVDVCGENVEILEAVEKEFDAIVREILERDKSIGVVEAELVFRG